MDISEVIKFIEIYSIEIILALSLTSMILVLLGLISQLRISKIKENYNELVRGSDRKNLEEILLELGKDMDSLTNNMNILERDLSELEESVSYSIKKVGLVRYDALDDISSQQSYSLTLLNEHYTGIILTSIYGRESSYNYIKPIVEGESEYNLSVEEMQSLDRAKNS